MEGISICLTAWHTQDFIEDTLDSIANQTWIKTHKNYEILLGIDHCDETLKKIQQIRDKYENLRVFFAEENNGTYILSNTIMSMAKYENILRFDTDDIMLPEMVETTMKEKNSDIVRYYFDDFPNPRKRFFFTHGTIMIKKSIFMKYGGYMPWRCAADTELLTRLDNLVNIKNIPVILMKRRITDSSLTRAKDTGMKSELRRTYHDYIHTISPNKPAIEMVTENIVEIFKDDMESPVIEKPNNENLIKIGKIVNHIIENKMQNRPVLNISKRHITVRPRNHYY